MRFAFAMVAIGLAMVTGARAQTPTWQNYAPADAGFSVQMPDQPTLKTDQQNGRPAYSAMVAYDKATAGADLVFIVKYQATQSKAGAAAGSILEGVVKAIAEGGKLLSDETETLGGYPARRFATEDADKDHYQVRAVLTDRYFIEVIFLGPLDNPLGKKFLDSFAVAKP